MPSTTRTDRRPCPHRTRRGGVGAVLAAVLAGLAAPGATTAGWDCRAAPGGGWDCTAAGSPPAAATSPAPAPGPAAATAPVREPAAQPRPPTGGAPDAPASATSAPPPAAASPTSPPGPDRHDATAQPGAPAPAMGDDATPARDAGDATPRPASDPYAGIAWSSCRPARRVGAFLDPWDSSEPGPDRADAEADTVEMDRASGTARLLGNVRFSYGPQTLEADQVDYDRDADTIDASGGVLLHRPEAQLSGTRARINLTTRQARLENADYLVPGAHARGSASVAEYLGENRSRFSDITFTTCQPGNDDWVLEANELELDHAEGLGTAHDAKLRFLGVPIGYLPRFTFPIDDRRRSGVLVPTLGHATNTGIDVRVPYYLNLAPNFDATLTPRYLSRRGLALGSEFRYLTPVHEGTLAGEILPNDIAFEGGQTRGTLSLLSHSAWSDRLTGDIRFKYASDSRYFEDLGSSLAVASARQLERAGELRYQGDNWNLLGRIQHYQTLDPEIGLDSQPYSRFPQVHLLAEQPDGPLGLDYRLLAEYAYFHKEDSVRGQRVDLYPGIGLPLRRPWGFVEPRAALRYTGYRLTDAERGGLVDDSPDRVLGIFSVDSGLYFDRRTRLFGNAVRQTLEPRLYYLYVPRAEQDTLPVFDTTALDFNFDSLFRDNRFNGPDRQGDANQLTLAVVSRTLDPRTGEEVLRAGIGQILYFNEQTVTLPNEPSEDSSTSPLVTEVAARISRTWRARAGLQWDPDDDGVGRITQSLAQVSYRDDERRVFNAAYRFRKGLVHQTDLAGLWPISDRASLIARWNYSVRDDRTLEALAGIEYGRCCWRARALLRRYADGADSDNLAFLVQLELFGLGRLGNDIDQYLERGIYGYRMEDYD